jgi:hypothetical protein
MCKFDPNAWQGTPHTAAFGESGKRATAPDQKNVPPIAGLTRGIKADAFWFSPESFPQTTLKDVKQGLGDSKTVKEWAVLALEDPAGITRDLSFLMAGRLESWLLNPDPGCPGRTTKWAMLAGKAISGIQGAVASQAENEAILEEAEKKTNVLKIVDQDPSDWANAGDGAVIYSQREKQSLLARYDDKEIMSRAKTKRDKAWEKYSSKYDSPSHQAWMNDFDSRLKAFDQASILPLAELHVAWSESKRFAAYFNGMFDPEDATSGLHYVEALTLCYAGVQDKVPCYNHMVKWLQKDMAKENLLVRALVLNLNKTMKDLQALSTKVEPETLPWDKMIAGHKELTLYVWETKGSVLARFFAATLGHGRHHQEGPGQRHHLSRHDGLGGCERNADGKALSERHPESLQRRSHALFPYSESRSIPEGTSTCR